jgi:limonene-1,2-epoxide hydrolase
VEAVMVHDNATIVREFMEAWTRLNAAELASFFADDGCYFNIPTQPIRGRRDIEKFIAGFVANWTRTKWEIVTLLSAGDVVMVERVDRTETRVGNVDLPCVGVFQMRNGKIEEWRDYFDLATYQKAMQAV